MIVFLGTLIGSFFVYIFANLIGKPSQEHGIPFPVLLRTSLGFKDSFPRIVVNVLPKMMLT